MNAIRNHKIAGSKDKPILLDVYYMNTDKPKPVVVFSHGFKGFKDWGNFDLIAEKFAANDFVFIKFNFSYNGTTVAEPKDFADLEAFGSNNFSIEMDDLGLVIDWILDKQTTIDKREIDDEKLYLLGHSRGGGITILKAAEDKRVKKIVTWSAVNEFGKRWPGMMEKMEKRGSALGR